MKGTTRVITISLIILVGVSIVLQSTEMKQLSSLYNSAVVATSLGIPNPAPQATTSCSSSSKPKIAIISGFVTRQVGKSAPQIKDYNYDHMLNKACYANLWGYDFIFNSTWGFDENVGSRYWLEYGTWHRVPHMAAALPNYDWIVYADVDWYVRDLTIPLESFISDWELHGFRNVSVFLPVDVLGTHVFSAYVVMIRNNAFGRRLIYNWLRFADGLCEKGNFDTTPGKYSWQDSDQPGIWYALAKTHSDFAGNNWEAECVDGKVKTGRVMGPEMRAYFSKYGVKFGGNQGKDLYNIPKGERLYTATAPSILMFPLCAFPRNVNLTMCCSCSLRTQTNPSFGPKSTTKPRVA